MKPGVSNYSSKSILIDFYYRNIRCREWIQLEPNARNLKYVENLKATIETEIAKGVFDYAKHFPKSRRAKKFEKYVPGSEIKVKKYLEDWLAAEQQNIKPSTWNGYRKILK